MDPPRLKHFSRWRSKRVWLHFVIGRRTTFPPVCDGGPGCVLLFVLAGLLVASAEIPNAANQLEISSPCTENNSTYPCDDSYEDSGWMLSAYPAINATWRLKLRTRKSREELGYSRDFNASSEVDAYDTDPLTAPYIRLDPGGTKDIPLPRPRTSQKQGSSWSGKYHVPDGKILPPETLPKTYIHIGGFYPSAEDELVGPGIIPAVKLALDHINKNSRILSNYILQISDNVTKCDPATGMKAFFDMIHYNPKKVMLFGASCTTVTDPVAKTSKFFKMTQLSCADTHPMFTRTNYPNLFRVVPSEYEFNPPRVELLRRFNWTRVGTLYQNEPRYALAHNKLLRDLDVARVEIVETQSFTDSLGLSLQKLKEKGVRIILGNFNEAWARFIFCEAYHQQMWGRKFQWIIVTMYRGRWWEASQPAINCTQSQLKEAMNGYIAIDLLPLRTDNVTTESGSTAEKYESQYNLLRNHTHSRFHGYAYDGIWTIALAIREVVRKLKLKRKKNITEFQYRHVYWYDTFMQALTQTKFEGVTGPISFINNSRNGFILINQFQEDEEVKVGEYDGVQKQLDLIKGKPIQWRGHSPPRDRTIRHYQKVRINVYMYSIFSVCASLGVVTAFSFLVVNVKFRNQRYIKMSSPYLNNLIIIGCMLTYSSVILLGLDSEITSVHAFPHICAVRAWVLMAGFTLAFGSMFSKTWRVHAIFTNIKLNKKVIKDYQLFLIVGILVCIDLAIMTTWQIIDPFYREVQNLTAQIHDTSQDDIIIPVVEFCKSDRMTIFLVIIYAYKGLLMGIGCFLAWETRNVSIPALNDSKYVGMSVYNVVIMCVMGAAISFILSDQQNAFFVLISIFIIFCSTTTLCLVFVPKMIELKRNPNGADKRVRATFKPSTRRRYDSDDMDIQEIIKQLQEDNQKCRKTLRGKDLEIQALVKQLGEDGESIADELRIRSRSILHKTGQPMLPASNAHKKQLNVYFLEEDEMNSMLSMSSSQENETTLMTTVDASAEKPKAAFSKLQSIPAGNESEANPSPPPHPQETTTTPQPVDSILRANAITIPPTTEYPPKAQHRVTFEAPPSSEDEVDEDEEEEEEEEERSRIEGTIQEEEEEEEEEEYEVEEAPEEEDTRHEDTELQRELMRYERAPEEKTERDNQRESFSSESDSEYDNAQPTTCSVFTIEKASPKSLQLRRALSWGRKGYRPMAQRKKRDSIPAEPPRGRTDRTGSLPNVIPTSGRRKSPPTASPSVIRKLLQMSPSTMKRFNLTPPPTARYPHHNGGIDAPQPHRPPPRATRSATTTPSPSRSATFSIKCDIVEYL